MNTSVWEGELECRNKRGDILLLWADSKEFKFMWQISL